MAAVAAPPTTPPPSEGSVMEAEVRPAVPSTVLTPRTLLVVSHTELDEDFSEPAMNGKDHPNISIETRCADFPPPASMRGGGESGAAGGSSASDGAAPAVGADGVLKYFKCCFTLQAQILV